jgi:hypothetical protein
LEKEVGLPLIKPGLAGKGLQSDSPSPDLRLPATQNWGPLFQVIWEEPMNSLATTVAFAVRVQKPSDQSNIRRLACDLVLLFPKSEIDEVVEAINTEMTKQRNVT